MATRFDQMKEQQALAELRRAGYTVTAPRRDGRPKSEFDQQWEAFTQDREAKEALLDRSRPKPAWMEGREAQVLKKLELELLGLWDAMQPFN